MIVIASSSKKVRLQWIQGLRCRMSSLVEVVDYPSLLQTAAVYKPSLILLDQGLPALGGLNGITSLRQRFPSSRIILFAGDFDEKEAVKAMKAGASGYYHVDIGGDLLIKAIGTVREDEARTGKTDNQPFPA